MLSDLLVVLWLVLLVVGLALIGVWLILAVIRAQAPQWEAARQHLYQQAAQLQQQLNQVSAAFEPAYPEPYALHYQRAHQIRNTVQQTLERAEADKQRVVATELPQAPPLALARIAPAVAELRTRWQWQTQTQQLNRHLATIAQGLQELETLRQTIAGLGQQMQAQLAQAQQTAQALEQRLHAEKRSARPLEVELTRLGEARETLADAAPLLAFNDPPKTHVVKAYPLLQQAAAELQTIANALQGHQTLREEATFNLESAQVAQTDLAQELAGLVQANQPAPRLQAQLAEQQAQLAQLRLPLEHGVYDTVVAQAKQLLAAAEALERALNELLDERAKVLKAHQGASEEVAQVRRWATELATKGFELDVTLPRIKKWEGDLARAQAEHAAEVLDTLRQAQAWCVAVTEQVQATRAARQELKTRLPRAEELRKKLRDKLATPANAPGLVERLVTFAEELQSFHPNYLDDLNLPQILTEARALLPRWQAAETGPIQESNLEGWLEELRVLGDEVFRLERQLEAMAQVRRRVLSAREQVLKRLNDPEVLKALALCERLAVGSGPDTLQTVKSFQVNHARLVAACAEIQANYDLLSRDAERLWQQLRPVAESLRKRLDESQTSLTALDKRFDKLQAALEDLAGDPTLDVPEAAALYAQVTEWRRQLPGHQQGGVQPALQHLAHGQQLLEKAQAPLAEMQQDVTRLQAACSALKRTIKQAHTQLDALQALFEQHHAQWNSAQWADADLLQFRNMLREAEQRLHRLEHPSQRLAFHEAMRRLRDIQTWVTEPAEQIAANQTYWVKKWHELEKAHAELEQIVERGQGLMGVERTHWQTLYPRAIEGWQQRLRRARDMREASAILFAPYKAALDFFQEK